MPNAIASTAARLAALHMLQRRKKQRERERERSLAYPSPPASRFALSKSWILHDARRRKGGSAFRIPNAHGARVLSPRESQDKPVSGCGIDLHADAPPREHGEATVPKWPAGLTSAGHPRNILYAAFMHARMQQQRWRREGMPLREGAMARLLPKRWWRFGMSRTSFERLGTWRTLIRSKLPQ